MNELNEMLNEPSSSLGTRYKTYEGFSCRGDSLTSNTCMYLSCMTGTEGASQPLKQLDH